jgi:hypothetical protein
VRLDHSVIARRKYGVNMNPPWYSAQRYGTRYEGGPSEITLPVGDQTVLFLSNLLREIRRRRGTRRARPPPHQPPERRQRGSPGEPASALVSGHGRIARFRPTGSPWAPAGVRRLPVRLRAHAGLALVGRSGMPARSAAVQPRRAPPLVIDVLMTGPSSLPSRGTAASTSSRNPRTSDSSDT